MSSESEADLTSTTRFLNKSNGIAVTGSPIGARRTRTDLKTSENIFLSHYPNVSRSRSRNSARDVIRPHSERSRHYQSQQQQLQQPQRQQHQDEQQQVHFQQHQQSDLHWQHSHAHQHHTQQHVAEMLQQHSMLRQEVYRNGNVADTCSPLSTNAPIDYRTSMSSKLPACATRLLNRSRLHQQHSPDCSGNGADSDSSRSTHSLRRNPGTVSRASTTTTTATGATQTKVTSNGGRNQKQQQQQQQQSGRSSYRRDSQPHSSSDDLMLYDKSFRNAMIHDVLLFKKQLLRLRRILQETETLNPFENDNGQLFADCGLDSKLLTDIDLASLTSSTTDDPIQELSDMRRQVVYLQGQVDDRDRTIRIQRDLIEKLEAEKRATKSEIGLKECINMATQTERTRPLSVAAEGLSRSKPEFTSYTTTYFPLFGGDSTTMIHQPEQLQHCPNGSNKTRRHTIISTTLTNYNNNQLTNGDRRSSITLANGAQQQQTSQQQQQQQLSHQQHPQMHKSVRITLIGDPLKPLNGYLNGCRSGNQQDTKKYKSTGSVATLNESAQLTVYPANERASYHEAKPHQTDFNTYRHYYMEQSGQLQSTFDSRLRQASPANCQQHNGGGGGGHAYPTVTIV